MASPPKSDSEPISYHPIPSQPDHTDLHENHVVLPLGYHPDHRRGSRCRFITTVSLLILAIAVYICWPSHPALQIVRLRLDHVQIHTVPRITVDISMSLSVKVRNSDLYSMNYSSIHVAVAYRGKELGHVKSDGCHVRAWRSSYVDAMVEFDGVDVLYDVVYLLEDLAKGTVPIDTVTEVKGKLGLFFFQIPLEAKVSCEVHVNSNNQTIVRQNCYSE